MGGLLARLETRLNRAWAPDRERRLGGILALAVLLLISLVASRMLAWLFSFDWLGTVLLVAAATSLLAQRSLHTHVRAVADALDQRGLAAGRQAVSMIVGRDTEQLSEAGVARAAIESLAENFSDGVVAPALWIAVAGLPGGVLYKAANTADSMIGHRTPRYAAFGWAAARFDDVVNLPASRLTAALLMAGAAVTGNSWRGAWRASWRDASRHRSPNAGWPESAMAGALDLRLAGPRAYNGALVDDAFMGDGRRDAGAADIRRALRLYRAACCAFWLVLLAVAVIVRS
jgi:adenosylcobinamide-phosphate synthase